MLLPPAIAAIHAGHDTRPFWEFCQRRELRFQRCRSCARFRHPPKPGCPHCGAPGNEWTRVTGQGQVFSYTVVHHPTLPALTEVVPYNVIVVEFFDAPGVRLISNLVDAPPQALHVGLGVELVWDEVRAGVVLPRFRAAPGTTAASD